jgi:prepilin-type processing-associated H-X9-DG protein
VVIAIITTLAALLLPSLSRAKSAADSAVCKSNLRQISLAIRMYVEQNGVYPTAEFWWIQLEPFAGTKWPRNLFYSPTRNSGRPNSVYACPAYNRLGGLFQPGGGNGQTFGSYGYNCWGVDGGIDNMPGWTGSRLGLGGEFTIPNGVGQVVNRQIREDQVLTPSTMNEIGDAFLEQYLDNQANFHGIIGSCILDRGIWDASFFTSLILGGNGGGGVGGVGARQGHGGRWNVGFCDGHVENLRGEDFFDLRKKQVLARWNNDNQPHREVVSMTTP